MLPLPPFFLRLPFFSSAGFGRVRLCLSSHRGTMCADAPESLLFIYFFRLRTAFAKFLKCVGNISTSANHRGMFFSIL